MIVGGGPAGLGLALMLSRTGILVWVVESSNYTEPRIGEHLPPDGLQTLNLLVPDRPLDGVDHQTSSGVDAYWGRSIPNQMDYLFHPIGAGVNLSRPRFDRYLATSCRDAGAMITLSAVLESATWKRTHWVTTLRLPSGSIELCPTLIVDATGRSASFARRQGATIIKGRPADCCSAVDQRRPHQRKRKRAPEGASSLRPLKRVGGISLR